MRMPKKMKIRLIIISSLLLLPCTYIETAFSNLTNKEPRVRIHIFKYSGLENQEALNYFFEFKEIIQAKILLIAEELQVQSPPFEMILELSPFFVLDEQGQHASLNNSSINKLMNRWKRSNALGIIFGRVSKVEQGYLIKSRIYFGELETQLDSLFLDIELPILDQEYDTTRDSHSAAILFALALDSKKRCRPFNETLALLSAAHEKLADLPSEMIGINELKLAIKKNQTMAQECLGENL